MSAPRVLRLLHPLLARPAQLRAGGARLESSCDSTPSENCEPCEPCKPAEKPKCRGSPATEIKGKRVVCCPPPCGKRPPCPAEMAPCPNSCENYMQGEKLALRQKKVDKCGKMQEDVWKRMRDADEVRRQQYEVEVKQRLNAEAAKPPVVDCRLSLPAKQELATDGRSYTVMGQNPMPRCDVGGPRRLEQPVQLQRPDCTPAGSDHCAHQPRTLLSIDRSAECTNSSLKYKLTNMDQRSESPEPCPLPKKHCDNKKGIGLKSRILKALSRGRSESPASGRASDFATDSKDDLSLARKAGDFGWCDHLKTPAPTPPCCRKKTALDRIKEMPKADCGQDGKRHLHTSTAAGVAKPAATREATIAAAKKLEEALKERKQLKEAGRGRTVRPPLCDEPPPPPKPTGGALELGVPPGADTVYVRVSVGTGDGAAPAAPCARAGPPAPCGAPHPTRGRGLSSDAGGSGSDSWLSIKSLQQKLSGHKPAAPLCGPSPTPAKPEPPSHPASGKPCVQRKPTKMTDIIPPPIFIKTL